MKKSTLYIRIKLLITSILINIIDALSKLTELDPTEEDEDSLPRVEDSEEENSKTTIQQ